VFLFFPLNGCCPYSRGLNVDISDRIPISAKYAYGFTLGYLSALDYRLWQQDEKAGYIRGSIERDSSSLGYRVEDVLPVSITDVGGRARLQISAETYRVGARREKVKVSKEVRKDASTLKSNPLENVEIKRKDQDGK
jgi:hypothetical protein